MMSLPVLGAAIIAPAHAQKSASQDEIVVIGDRSALGLLAERTLTEDEVAGYGLNSIGSLLAQIARERGDDDEPIYLVDGQRVSGLGDIESYPTEAIEKIQVLPTGSAVRVGAAPNRRILNIVLKPRLRTGVGQAGLGRATGGGGATGSADLSATDIRRPRRINLALRVRRDELIRESERRVVQAAEAPADLGRFRTLRPKTESLELRASAADRLTPDLNASVTARLFESRTTALLGRASAGDALTQRSGRRGGSADLQFNRDLGDWLLVLSSTYFHERRLTQTERSIDPDLPVREVRTAARTSRTGAELAATGPLLALPAGPLGLSLRTRLNRNAIATEPTRFVQWSREFGLGLQVPIASAMRGGLRALGDLSLGLDVSRSRLSRLGTLSSVTYSFQWRPVDWLRLSGSRNVGRSPPGVELLAGPLIETPGIRYLDPLRGETVDVLELSGGNPDLGTQRTRDQRLSLSLTPFKSLPLLLSADYTTLRNRDTIATLPSASDALLLAFPGRFLRDLSGTLVGVDVRPVSFARESEERLRQGFELNLPLGIHQSGGASTRPRQLQISVSHSILLQSEVVLASGLDAIDLLSRDAIALGGAARPKREIDVTLGYSAPGFGFHATAQHRSASFLGLTDGERTSNLRFSALTTLGVRAFIDGSQISSTSRWLRGARLTLSVLNLGNVSQSVRDDEGSTPLRYQAAYLDPLGRAVRLEFRKTF